MDYFGKIWRKWLILRKYWQKKEEYPPMLLIAEIWNDSDLINKPGPWRADNLATLHHSHLWLSSLFNDPRLRGGAQARLKRVSSVALSDRARPIKCLGIFEGVLRASSWQVLIRCLIKISQYTAQTGAGRHGDEWTGWARSAGLGEARGLKQHTFSNQSDKTELIVCIYTSTRRAGCYLVPRLALQTLNTNNSAPNNAQ